MSKQTSLQGLQVGEQAPVLGQKKLFRYALLKHTDKMNKQSIFMLRNNRWRFNPFNRARVASYLRPLKHWPYILIFLVVMDWTVDFYEKVPEH